MTEFNKTQWAEKEHHSKLDTLTDQLNGLKDVGFKEVDCFYKVSSTLVCCGQEMELVSKVK